MTLERLEEVLDAYGAAPRRGPEEEQEAVRSFVEKADGAPALVEDAQRLDRMLDSVRVAPPSPLLAAQVLAAAPRRKPRRVRRWAIAAAVPLAAAAALALWVSLEREPAHVASDASTVWVGEYTSPTDVLLEPYGVDVYATIPSVGCSDSALGCPEVDRSAGKQSGIEGQGLEEQGRFRA